MSPKVCECCGRPLPSAYSEAALSAGLTAQERDLFLAIADSPSDIVTYQSIIDSLWGNDGDGGPLGADRVVFTVACRTNRKMARFGYRLANVRCVGYRLTTIAAEAA